MSLSDLARGMVEAVDPDRQLEAARTVTGKDQPDAREIAAATKQLLVAAVEPLATNPELRTRLIELRRQQEQMIDARLGRRADRGQLLQGRDRPRA